MRAHRCNSEGKTLTQVAQEPVTNHKWSLNSRCSSCVPAGDSDPRLVSAQGHRSEQPVSESRFCQTLTRAVFSYLGGAHVSSVSL